MKNDFNSRLFNALQTNEAPLPYPRMYLSNEEKASLAGMFMEMKNYSESKDVAVKHEAPWVNRSTVKVYNNVISCRLN